MADRHKHDHGHTHDYTHDRAEPAESAGPQPEDLDAAGKSLSDALRISFAILKVIMIILVVAFLASGFRTVESGEKGIVLRFGQIQRVVDPGWVWVFPYPIDELIRIPVDRRINLPVNSFWYRETREDILESVKQRNYRPEVLNPLQEGYCLTRSEEYESDGGAETRVPAVTPISSADPRSDRQPTFGSQSDGSDYSIVHTKWQIDYQIENIDQFFKNVYIADVRPGQVYFDIMTRSVTPLLRSIIEDAVVNAMVQYTIDEALQSIDTIPRRVQQFVQEKLDAISSGMRVTSVRLVKVEWPKQVEKAFQESITASQKSQEAITQARTYAGNTLNEVAGRVGEQLYRALLDENSDAERQERLWAQVAGKVHDTIAQAQAYKTRVVATTKANADYLLSLLPEYQKRPDLVTQAIYLAAIEEVLAKADEKFIIQQSSGTKDHEIRILVNRDQAKPKRQQQPQATN